MDNDELKETVTRIETIVLSTHERLFQAPGGELAKIHARHDEQEERLRAAEDFRSKIVGALSIVGVLLTTLGGVLAAHLLAARP